VQPNPSPEVARRLDQTLGQWRAWRCESRLRAAPEIDRALGEGLSNHVFLTQGPQRCVIRIDGEDPRRHGLNRAVEWRTLTAAWRAGIAPRPVYYNPELGCLVCAYVEPPPVTGSDIRHSPAAIAALLRAVHKLPRRRFRLDFGARIEAYAGQLHTQKHRAMSHLVPVLEPVRQLLRLLENDRQATVLCHNDLLLENRLCTGETLCAIDWEYCAMAPALYDVAVVIEGDALDDKTAQMLVRDYLGRFPNADEQTRLARYRLVYACLALLWHCASDNAPLTETAVAAQAQDLARRLAAAGLPGEG
jgi:aminoglycoside phosphotransferase (APT) family kinase protein